MHVFNLMEHIFSTPNNCRRKLRAYKILLWLYLKQEGIFMAKILYVYMNFLYSSVVYNSPQAFIQIFEAHALYKHGLVLYPFLVVSFSLPWI